MPARAPILQVSCVVWQVKLCTAATEIRSFYSKSDHEAAHVYFELVTLNSDGDERLLGHAISTVY